MHVSNSYEGGWPWRVRRDIGRSSIDRMCKCKMKAARLICCRGLLTAVGTPVPLWETERIRKRIGSIECGIEMARSQTGRCAGMMSFGLRRRRLGDQAALPFLVRSLCVLCGAVVEDYQTVRLSDCQTVRLSDCQTVRLSDYQTIRLSDYQTVRLSDCQTVRLSDCQIPDARLRSLQTTANNCKLIAHRGELRTGVSALLSRCLIAVGTTATHWEHGWWMCFNRHERFLRFG